MSKRLRHRAHQGRDLDPAKLRELSRRTGIRVQHLSQIHRHGISSFPKNMQRALDEQLATSLEFLSFKEDTQAHSVRYSAIRFTDDTLRAMRIARRGDWLQIGYRASGVKGGWAATPQVTVTGETAYSIAIRAGIPPKGIVWVARNR